MGPSFTSDDLSEPDSQPSSMPGSYEDKGGHFPAAMRHEEEVETGSGGEDGEEYDYDDNDIFDDDLLATGEMRNVPF
jgi:phosphatidate phosphatase LPIN